MARCCSSRWLRTATGQPAARHYPAGLQFPGAAGAIAGTDRVGVLELFHGPTAAFKDFGARFLAACMARLPRPGQRPLNILVATTSGDTGGAVAAAFHRLPGVQVSVLYPKGLCPPAQEQQLTCWGDNVRSFRVRGTFDDCQRLVKAAFMDAQLNELYELTSANSINLGRLHARRRCTTRPRVCRAGRNRARRYRSSCQRQSWKLGRGPVGAPPRHAHRQFDPGAQPQSHRAGFA